MKKLTVEELQKKIEEAERNELLVIAAILRLQKYRAEREEARSGNVREPV